MGGAMTRGWMLLGALLAVCLCTAPVRAQHAAIGLAETVFRPVAAASTVPSAVVPSIMVQDGSGLLWAGGDEGILRWDGYRFVGYSSDLTPQDGLLDHGVLAMYSDAQGTLWVGTAAGGLARYNPAQDRFVTLSLAPERTRGAGEVRSVNAIDGDGAGGLWVASNAGLFRIDNSGTVIATWRHEPARADSLPADRVAAVVRDRAGALWVGAANGLARTLPGGAKPNSFVPVGLPTPAGEPADIRQLMLDSGGRIWVATRQQGAYVVEPDGSTHGIAATMPPQTDEAGGEIKTMAEVAPGRVWLGTFGRGIVEVDQATLATRHIGRDPSVPNSLDHDTVHGLYRDSSGVVWVSTTLGLSQASPGNTGIETLFGRAGQAGRLSTEDAIGVLVRPDGTLWVGSSANGIDILGPDWRKRGNLPVSRVWCLAAEPAGPVYIGARGGLFVADAGGKQVARLDVPGRNPHEGVFGLTLVGGKLWVAGRTDGVWELQPEADGRMTVLRHVTAPLLNDDTIHTIAALPDGSIAIGSENGVNLLDPGSGRVTSLFPGEGTPPGTLVESLLVDLQGRLWIGMDGGGILVWTGRDPGGRAIFHHLGGAEGMPHGGISAMKLDRRGRIWASTDHGLAVIDPASFAVRALGAPDGVAITQYWAGAVDMDARGELVFGGVGGITVVRPDEVAPWNFEPPVVITSLQIGGRQVPICPGGDGPVRFYVPADANSFTVEFSALDYSAPDQNRYRYRLDGFDRDWVPTDAAHRFAAYTNLPPGDYTWHLAGSNRNGVWTLREATLRLRVQPAWFQTIWFRVIECVAAGALVTLLVHARTVVLRRRQRELEHQVAERTAELSESQKQLRQLAYFDSLTALPNRRAFNEECARMVAAAQGGQPFALVMVDLDGFKKVNDTLGHDAGDEVLVIAAGRLREAVRDGDFVARLGGDEFAVLLHAVRDQGSADLVCERICTLMAAPVSLKNGGAKIGASLGVALCLRDGRTQDQLYKYVELALYDAKRAGRGVWRWYREGLLVP